MQETLVLSLKFLLSIHYDEKHHLFIIYSTFISHFANTDENKYVLKLCFPIISGYKNGQRFLHCSCFGFAAKSGTFIYGIKIYL